ncbi:phage tail protein [Vibrio sp. HN007]|uniref:phage tail protein n=1 Tax=Vibrio iocasae TaxID=3098914 RepID=UPI0035D3EDDF
MKSKLRKITIGAAIATSLFCSTTSLASTPFLGEVAWVPYNFAPRGWAFCDGQILAISQNTALFSLIGTIYGGDGRTTFALPDVRSRTIMHEGTGPGLTSRALGEKAGQEQVALSVSEIPSHTHTQKASSGSPTTTSPANAALASPTRTRLYAEDANVNMSADNIAATGGGLAHDNMQPYTTLNCIIAIQGVYPSRS